MICQRLGALTIGIWFLLRLSLAGPAAAAGDTARIGLPGEPRSLNPLIATTSAESELDCAIFSGLTVLDDRGNIKPDLAQEVPSSTNGGISTDGLTLIYLLRPGLHWQDGVALTADDIVFTFYAMHDPRLEVPLGAGYANVASVDARDYETVVVHLKTPDANAVSELFVNGRNGSILPRHILGNVRDLRHTSFNRRPIGSGPYILESWQQGRSLRLRANHRYFQGAPAIEHLSVAFVPNAKALVEQVRSGHLDFARGIDPSLVSEVRKTPAARVVQKPTYALAMLAIRVDAPQLSDPRIRRALGRAIGRDEIVSTAYFGFARPASELIPPWSPWNTARAIHPADPNAARALLDAAGWPMGRNVYRERDGQRLALTLTIPASNRAALATATLLRAQWKAIGVDVELQPVGSNGTLGPDGILTRRDFTVALITDEFGANPDRSALLGSNSIPPNGDNVARYRNGEVDQAIATANTSLVPAERKRAMATIARDVATDAPYVPIAWLDTIYAIANRLDGVKPEPANSDLWNVYAWRLR